ncbi:hypothetical protein B0H14DRAFT_3006310, partial [Mycena olivaceomarginata]
RPPVSLWFAQQLPGTISAMSTIRNTQNYVYLTLAQLLAYHCLQRSHYPVLVIAGYSYWAFSWTDNRVGLAILAYDPNNNLPDTYSQSSTTAPPVVWVFTGQVGNTITIPIIQLLEPIVFMSTENAATQPAAPSGLDYVTFFGDNMQYPVLIVGSYTYWPLSYVDNRESLNLVGYDQNKNLISQLELPGTRYIETVIYDPDVGVISLIGQSPAIVTASIAQVL